MNLTVMQMLISIFAIAAATFLTRALPFILFASEEKTPAYINYLGQVLPAAAMGLLVVFSLKSVSLIQFPYGLPEFVAILAVCGLHKWKHNMLLSVGGGTLIYMLLMQYIFI